ncbi:unnamed protein product [Anisakis simplex]|uniref:Uncharacterized protein n=1 Tax=Anisakis simplex TaxID=6269 RepID=A0A0M3JCF7_ANISI|nr:unnamed protein product [Anisakis simplex]
MQQPQQLQQQQLQQQQLQQQQLHQQQLQQQQLQQQQLQQQQLQQQQLQQQQLQQQQLQQQQLQQQQQVQQQQQEPQWESVRSDDRRFEPSGRQQTTPGFGTGTAPENQNFGIRLSQRPVSPQQQFPPSSEREFISPSDRQQPAQQTQPQQWSIETQRFGSVSRPTQPPLASVQHPQSRWTHAHVQQPAALHQSQPQPLPQPQPLQASSQQALPTQQPFDAHAQEHISSRRPEEFVWRPQADSANRRSRPSDFFRKNGSDPYECMDILCLCPYMGGKFMVVIDSLLQFDNVKP